MEIHHAYEYKCFPELHRKQIKQKNMQTRKAQSSRFFHSSRIVSSYIISILPNLRNLTEEKPPCPSNTAANENPSRPSDRTTASSSISSRGPCRVVDPQRTPATPVSDDGALIAIAEQHRLLALVVQVDFLGGFKLELL
jgi:hypothetical protein